MNEKTTLTKSLSFSIDASIIERLGRELVAKKETALSELVKNAYDADATEVTLIFKKTDTAGGTLIIEDDGMGMTEEQLINGFLRVSSTEKIINPRSEKFKRKRAGRKGIGRFAAHRLGKKLTVITQTEKSNYALKISINWENFKPGLDLSDIHAEVETIEKEKNEGTKLIIENLRDPWPETSIEIAYRYLRDILQPFPLSKRKEGSKKDPGFKVLCYKEVNGDRELIIDETKSFYEHALAVIEAFVDENGVAYYTLESKKLNLKEDLIPINEDNPYKFIKDVYLKAYYFLYRTELLPKGIMGFIRETAKKYGGIRLYRNGFRVLPYAEPDDDWLGLDESERRRDILQHHGNMHFFGFIEITDEEGNLFEEKSDREGLIENDAFKELQEFGYKSIIAAMLKIASARGIKPKAGIRDWKQKIETAEEKIRTIEHNIESLEIKKEIQEVRKNLEEAIEEVEEEKKQLLDEIGFLRVLAGLGLIIGEFVHEIKQTLSIIKINLNRLIELSDKFSNIKEIVKKLKDNVMFLSNYTYYFDKSMSENINRELNEIDLRGVINEFIEIIKTSRRYGNINVDVEFDTIAIMTRPMHRSEVISILMNLYTNAVKAINRAHRQEGRIKIKAGEEDDMVFIEFSDNGDGIPPEQRERIFDAFYTTHPPSERFAEDHKELIGMGLGLKIVKDIVEGYDGKIYVKDNPEKGYVTTFRIELPKGEGEVI